MSLRWSTTASSLDEPELLAAVRRRGGIALENARLQAELRARLEELQGSRARVIEAGQQERQRLERDLHDGAQQRLVALSLELSLLEKQRWRRPGCAASGSTPRSARSRVSLDELRDRRARASIRPCSAATGSRSRSSRSPRGRRCPSG